MSWSVGLDFGTTNSAISVIDGAGEAGLVNFYRASGPTPMFRSVLYFDPDEVAAINGRPVPVCGPQGIDLYLEEDDGTGRLMQSLKTWLASKSFSHTVVGQRTKFTLEQLISILLKDLRAEAEAKFGDLGARAVVGRPVHLSQPANPERDEHGIKRLRDALGRAGFDEVTFVYEPVAAAYHYERRLERDEVVMIADFGGGTSDFSIIRVGPSRVGRQDRQDDILGTNGVPLAGNAFDSRLVQHLVAPHLGLGSRYRTAFGKELEIPRSVFKLRWHELSTLRSRKTLEALRDYTAHAVAPKRIANFLALVENDLGYHLYQAVERTKIDLSRQPGARFVFREPPIDIDVDVQRSDFEAWIAPELEAITQCVDSLMADIGLPDDAIDRVFMTGGSSFIPAVRRIFAERFGADKLRSGEELTSVASGLALYGHQTASSA